MSSLTQFRRQLSFPPLTGTGMTPPRLSKLELKIMELLWEHGRCSIREIQERIVTKPRPAYTTIQTVFGRLESKNAVRRVKKVGGAHIYEASVSREEAQRKLIKISYRL